MTAEIAILNNSGIALAADSAVTIGKQKVYNSANKLFTLSKYEPVGIMVYDSADFVGVPWELIIKEYRTHLGNCSFDTLKEYADDFWNFINDSEDIIPLSKKKQYVFSQSYNYLCIIYERLKEKAHLRIADEGETTLENSISDLVLVVEEHESVMGGAATLPEFVNTEVQDIVTQWSEEITDVSQKVLGQLFKIIEDGLKNRLFTLIASLFVKDEFLLSSTGVVFAGFGRRDHFPQIASYRAEGIHSNIVKKSFLDGKSNVQKDEFVTTIVPFAQDEMVWTFMDGMDPDVSDFANTFLDDVFQNYPQALNHEEFGIDEETMNNIKETITQDGRQLLERFRAELNKYQRKNNIQPIIDMVGVLPKDELAAMAESLVNLTVFKRKVSKSVETVGGPIDVAVISKGDGFIWVKRKHYFKPELNQHFLSNYFRQRGQDNG